MYLPSLLFPKNILAPPINGNGAISGTSFNALYISLVAQRKYNHKTIKTDDIKQIII